MTRASGIFLHLTSLPSRYGIGDLGHDAFRWIDKLHEAHQKVWQICPVGPGGMGFSPYMSVSTFASDYLIISPDLLKERCYLTQQECDAYPMLPTHAVDFPRVQKEKTKLFHKAFSRFSPTEEYHQFCKKEAYWLDDYVLFMTLYIAHDGLAWSDWPAPLKNRQSAALNKWQENHHAELAYERFLQFMCHLQWQKLHTYAQQKEVKIFGDLPIYVAYNSADVWAHQDIFQLDADGVPQHVGGVPPDYFSEDGQLWGNPLYDWDKLKSQNYKWWAQRLKRAYEACDIVRIDHFRALEAYWSIPGDSPTAKFGRWVKGPGNDFFRAIKEQLGDIHLIAEDLGTITEEVNALRDSENLAGMKVLQFAFDGNPHNWYLPYNVTAKSVMYSGTHDNDTTVGWFSSLSPEMQAQVCQYLACAPHDVHYHLMREVMNSVSELAILPLQDVLYLGSEARFNVPGTVEHNWVWRVQWSQCEHRFFEDLKRLTLMYGRG